MSITTQINFKYKIIHCFMHCIIWMIPYIHHDYHVSNANANKNSVLLNYVFYFLENASQNTNLLVF